ncbi:response regulator [Mucilaginibacter corticis]|uniref:histidine kinase n=1 Tax=Mucilaginibacter corticis TaxID=2597670 RepID=A0A556M9B2_9SPHI|nr:response regulator [Mucilaginibacter corticis]TSJ36468.1 response regulator [Mucilaginibacter corticis]
MEVINILIVDDNADNLHALELSLERDNVVIFSTTSPGNVLKICAENDISIALIDVKMPDIDGFQVLEMIKSDPLTAHIMVILITGYSMSSEHVVKGLSNGAVDYLFKPLDLYITIAKVNSLITLVNYQKEIKKKNEELEVYQHELFKAIRKTEKSKIIKENFLANMSHEIRTPLNAIIGLTHLLKDTENYEEQQEMIRLMEHSSQALLGIVNDILESAKIDAGKVEIVRTETDMVNLVETICDLTRPMAKEKGLDLVCEIGDNVPAMMMADSLRINQILINIINNAIKFTLRGSVTVNLKLIEKNEDKALLQFTVKDSGIGISKSSIDKIFTRFEQVEDKTWQKFGGTGLGLSIVKRLIKLKGGTLHVESEIGVGTTFTFENWFHLAEHAQVEGAQQQAVPGKMDNLNILLADDDESNQYIIVEMLKEWNITVAIAENGWEAIEKLKENNFDLILMDTHMPVMNGYETTRWIRKEMPDPKKNIPILAFSASVIEKEKRAATEAGANDFIEKPFEINYLVNKIKDFAIR